MRKFFGSMGSVARIIIESQVLKNNMLGDPSERAVDVYVPAGHDGQGLPLLVDLVGFTSSGLSHTNWVGFRENLPERLQPAVMAPPLNWLASDAAGGVTGRRFLAGALGSERAAGRSRRESGR